MPRLAVNIYKKETDLAQIEVKKMILNIYEADSKVEEKQNRETLI